MEEGKDVKTPPKEKIVVGASGDIDGTTVFTERKGKDGFIRESYSWLRSEKDKKRIIERNRKRREQELEGKKKDLEQQTQEKSQTETSPNSDKQEHQVEKDNNLQDNKDNNSKSIYYGIGVISLVLLVISMI